MNRVTLAFSSKSSPCNDENDVESRLLDRMLEDPALHGGWIYTPKTFDHLIEPECPPYNAHSVVRDELRILNVPMDIVQSHAALADLGEQGRIPRLLDAKRYRLYTEYGLNDDDWFCIMGSWRYGLADKDSDYDLRVVRWSSADLPLSLQPSTRMARGAYYSIYHLAGLHKEVMEGSRYAFEIITSPMSMKTRGTAAIRLAIDDISKRAFSCGDWTKRYLGGSAKYVARYGPRLLGSPLHEPDWWLRVWKAKKGWAYKLGYYIAVDALICQHVLNTGTFDPMAACAGSLVRLAKYKHGEVPYDEWLDDMRALMPAETFRVLEARV